MPLPASANSQTKQRTKRLPATEDQRLIDHRRNLEIIRIIISGSSGSQKKPQDYQSEQNSFTVLLLK
jgi:hypothetical protein